MLILSSLYNSSSMEENHQKRRFQQPALSVCVVASICVALLLDGGIILYGCLVWAEDTSSASYTVAVLTFAVCFSLPVVLIGVFLVTISSNQMYFRETKCGESFLQKTNQLYQ